MKNVLRLLAVAVVFTVGLAFAANLDGDYKFTSRTKEGKPDLAGWNGTMKIAGGTMRRDFTSPDGKETKFYESSMKDDGHNVYSMTFTKAYKPEYVGKAYKNKVTVNGNKLVVSDVDGKFTEEWVKK